MPSKPFEISYWNTNSTSRSMATTCRKSRNGGGAAARHSRPGPTPPQIMSDTHIGELTPSRWRFGDDGKGYVEAAVQASARAVRVRTAKLRGYRQLRPPCRVRPRCGIGTRQPARALRGGG